MTTGHKLTLNYQEKWTVDTQQLNVAETRMISGVSVNLSHR
jgi:phage FluMu gp28-like protein